MLELSEDGLERFADGLKKTFIPILVSADSVATTFIQFLLRREPVRFSPTLPHWPFLRVLTPFLARHSLFVVSSSIFVLLFYVFFLHILPVSILTIPYKLLLVHS